MDKISFKNNLGKIYVSRTGTIKIIEGWGLNNKKHTSKHELYKEFKTYIPFSKTEERLAVLAGKLDLDEQTEICKKRKSPGK